MNVYNCLSCGWVTEKECKDCFEQNRRHKYGHIKHCRRDYVIEVEDNKDEE
jgi:hypothetical protein